MNEYLVSYSFYLLLILGLLVGFGFLFNQLVVSGWKKFGRIFGYRAFYPRFIGTLVHELGHLLFALITGSRINKVKLFPVIDRKNRSCGGAYVSFAPRHGLMGSFSLFLSGIGPMLFCPFVIMVLMYFLVPELYLGILNVIPQVSLIQSDNLAVVIRQVLYGFFGSFQPEMLTEWKFWLFLVLSVPIANECVLSGADIKSAGKGLIVLLVLLAIVGYALSFLSSICLLVVAGLKRTATFLICVFCLALMFNLLHWLLGTALGMIFK